MSRVNISKVSSILSEIFKITNPDDGHGLEHALAVHQHALKAIKSHPEHLEGKVLLSIELASLLHDVGDHKFVRDVKEGYWEEYFFLKYFKLDTIDSMNEIYELVMTMINLVSCSRSGDLYNGNETWLYIPRYCDRLESIGEIGVQRTLIYSKYTNRPMYDDTTKMVFNLKELKEVATNDRYQKYISTGKPVYSNTTIDHFYDKILHINIPQWMENKYLIETAKLRQSFVIGWLLGFWVSNTFKI